MSIMTQFLTEFLDDIRIKYSETVQPYDHNFADYGLYGTCLVDLTESQQQTMFRILRQGRYDKESGWKQLADLIATRVTPNIDLWCQKALKLEKGFRRGQGFYHRIQVSQNSRQQMVGCDYRFRWITVLDYEASITVLL